MIHQVNELAQETGARIVHFCANDCVPWDIATLELANFLKKNFNEDLKSVTFYDEMNLNPSGGTLATVVHSLATLMTTKQVWLAFVFLRQKFILLGKLFRIRSFTHGSGWKEK